VTGLLIPASLNYIMFASQQLQFKISPEDAINWPSLTKRVPKLKSTFSSHRKLLYAVLWN